MNFNLQNKFQDTPNIFLRAHNKKSPEKICHRNECKSERMSKWAGSAYLWTLGLFFFQIFLSPWAKGFSRSEGSCAPIDFLSAVLETFRRVRGYSFTKEYIIKTMIDSKFFLFVCKRLSDSPKKINWLNVI